MFSVKRVASKIFRFMNPTILKIGVPLTIFTLLTASQANAQTTLSGFGYPAANGVPTDSALVQLINPSNDTITTKIGRIIPNYWNKTSQPGWIDDGDTCKVIVTDTTGQTAETFKVIEFTNYAHTLFPGGHAFLINKVINGVDSVDAKCYSIGPAVWSDTLEGRFRIGIPHDDIYFNREGFQNPPALNDSVVFEVSEGSLYARTGCKYERALWDADSAPNCSLQIVGIEENLEKKIHNPLIIKPNPVTNGIIQLNQKGEFTLYNIIGNQVKKANGNKIDVKGLPSGAYFLFTKPKDNLLYKPEKVVILN